MRTKQRKPEQGGSFIEQARRRQLIECTIASVAAEGYAGASLAKVARRANVSKGVVLYHFRNKDELVELTVAEIFRELGAFIQPRIEAESTARGRLRAFIASELSFLEQHRAHLLAVSYLLVNHRNTRGEFQLRARAEQKSREVIAAILADGQKRGEFRVFAVQPMVVTILNAVNGALSEWVVNPELSLTQYAAELVATFDLATVKTSRALGAGQRR